MFSDDERTFIERHRVGRLATADTNCAPHVVPIVYALVDGNFYFVVDEKPKRTKTALKRLRNLADNPQVALLIDDYSEDWTRLAFVLVHGRAARVDDRDEYAGALEALRRRYRQYESMPLAFDSNPMVRITPTRRHMWRAAVATRTRSSA